MMPYTYPSDYTPVKVRFEFGGLIATAYPETNPDLQLLWDLLGGEIEAVTHNRPLGTVGHATTRREFQTFAQTFIGKAFDER